MMEDDLLIVVGNTKNEMGGSEYFEYIHKFIGGKCPVVDFDESKKNMESVLKAIESQLVKSAHDCSKGGLAVAISEMCMKHQIGCKVKLEKVPGEKIHVDRVLFSESHSRYLLVSNKKNVRKLESLFKKNKVSFNIIGQFGGTIINFGKGNDSVIDLAVGKAQKTWLNSLRELVLHG